MSQPAPAVEWQQIKSIFLEAVELPPEERAHFLNAVCGTSQQLRDEVERLLRADAEAEDFLEQAPVTSLHSSLYGSLTESLPLQRIGAYKILREIGRGGMGTVYLAQRDDDVSQQQVAIKILSSGRTSDEMQRRFRRERIILSSLNHPHIARLLDGGATEDGRPYYVMEYIVGRNVDEYCTAHGLSLKARLRLFQDICHTVHYAHQRLVIHRDLKPSNILVTEEGEVKLLDFGIAKLLTDDLTSDHQTITGHALMTPAYASPEQIRGETISTISDVYALGIILYEMLTGTRPYDFQTHSIEEIVRIISEAVPVRPSEILRQQSGATGKSTKLPERKTAAPHHKPQLISIQPSALRGDLDNILLKALHKDAQRRYSSAEQLSADIERHLEGLPITARPDTIRYRVSKFVQRNRAATIIALLTVALLSAGIVITTMQARVARRERALAEHRFDQVRQLANSFVLKYQDDIASLPGSIPIREMMVRDAITYLDTLNQEAHMNAALKLELSQAYLKIGDMQGKPYQPNLGDTNGARQSYEKALMLCESVIQPTTENPEQLRLLSVSHSSLGALLVRAGKFDEAFRHLQTAQQLGERGLQLNPESRVFEQQLALIYLHSADAVQRSQNFPNAETQAEESFRLLDKALKLREKAVIETPNDPVSLRALAVCHQRLGRVLEVRAHGSRMPAFLHFQQTSLYHHRQSVHFFEKTLQTRPDNTQARRDLTDEYLMKATVEAAAGNSQSALADCQYAVSEFDRMVAIDPRNAELRRDLATAWYVTSNIQQQQKKYQEGIASMKNSLRIFQTLAEADPGNLENHHDIHNGTGRRLGMEVSQNNIAAIAPAIQEITDWYQRMIAANPQSIEWRKAQATFLEKSGRYCLTLLPRMPLSFRQQTLDMLKKSLALQTELMVHGHLSANDLEPVRDLLAQAAAGHH